VDKEGGREVAKAFLRLGEITYALLIAGPTAAYLLGKEPLMLRFVVALAIGFAAGLTFFIIGITLLKRWKA
jgi:hypothetical protein